ncbi:MAG: 30S ribosomal protein S16 [Candidatus Omnitrophica bacterium]|nr:30S ribosomal protein S16 [Candidatus Omnitrophota bacterium]MCK5306651.1 30S ribosomal protein S16 [Candidatus Omnitrophota bacterium]
MSTRIRLKRIGTKKRAVYRIVVCDSRSSRDGSVIEELGTYDPNQMPELIQLKKERAKYWVGEGAVSSRTVESILKKQEIK